MLLELIGLLLVISIIYWYISKPNNLPPGPSGIPLLGYLPWIIFYSKNREKLLMNLQKYGSVASIRIGFQYFIFLNHIDTIKEAFKIQGEKFAGGGLKVIQSEITHSKGIVSADGKYQRENRRFILKSLRNMGFGKMSFEDHILDSIDTMCESIDKHISEHPNESYNFEKCLTVAVAANITKILFGESFNKKDLDFLIGQMKFIQNVPQLFFIVNSFPYITTLIKFKPIRRLVGVDKFKSIRVPLQNMIMRYISNHKSSFDRNNITDFVYDYLDEQTNHQNTNEESYWWDDEQIKHSCTDLIGAGLGTITNLVPWVLFNLAENPEWMEKVINEIDSVIGREKKPSMSYLTSLPICEATILETLRHSVLTPIGFPRIAGETTQISEYSIPKNATVISNNYCISRNKDIFADPDHFNPAANFLSRDLKVVISKDKFLPFGIGRRSCIGESLARMESILFFVALFQRYSVSLDPKMGRPPISNSVFRIPVHKIIKFESRI